MRKVIRTVTAKDGTKAQIVKHGRSTYSLTVTSRQVGRNRWGNKQEIEADAKHFEEHGVLPGPNGPRW